MSPNVGNFVHDLVEMAKAMEMLPQVQSDLEQANKMNAEQGAVIAAREESILKLKAEIENLHATIHNAEVARDHAETMFLECDDKLAAFHRLVTSFNVDTAALLKAQEPPKPEPVVEPEVMRSSTEHQASGQSEPLPSTVSNTEVVTHHDVADSSSSVSTQPAADPTPTSPGQSEPDPTHSDANSTGSSPVESASPTGSAQSTTEPDHTTNPSHDNDPEPTRYDQDGYTTREWWQWSDRQDDKVKYAT